MHGYDKISAWAARVQPGSPAPPSSRFSPSSPSFLPNLTPPPTTPKLVDLTALGYTTIFVHFPKTPSTPSPYLRPRHPTTTKEKEMAGPTSQPQQQQQQQQRSTSSAFRRLRSLANLGGNRSRSKSVSAGAGASSTAKPTTTTPKKPKYTHVLPPPPLANDLALMQFADGGSIESHAQRVMKAHARAAAAGGVGVVHRDDKGNMWWDQDEEYEYAHLLDGESADMYAYQGNEGVDAWVRFGNQSPSASPPGKQLERRESLSTQESDVMDARNVVKPVEEGAVPITVPGLSVLSVPARAKKPALLRKPEFLVDVAAFGPRSPGVSGKEDASRPKGKARRRPAPLKIPSVASTSKRPSNPSLPTAGSLPSADRVRREFIENSFKPIPPSSCRHPLSPPALPTSTCRVATHTEATKPTSSKKSSAWRLRSPSRLDLRAMFGAGIRNE